MILLDPSLFTLPFDLHFARALAAVGARPHLVGRPLRAYEQLDAEPFPFHPLFYRWSEGAERSWQRSPLRRAQKAVEHVFGHRRLARLIAQEQVSVLHVQWLPLPVLDHFFLARLRPRLRLFLTVHNASLLPHDTPSLWDRLLLPARADLLALFDGFIAHTEQSVRQLEASGIDRRRILFLPHPPLQLQAANPTAAPGASGPPQILFFGAIKPYKGVDVLISAALQLAARGRPFRLTIAGRPYLDLEPLRARIRAAGAEAHFTFALDYIPDNELDALLRQADIIVFPYREIDGSGAMALAASYGKAMVASRVGMFAEPPVAERVALVEPDDVAALAATLERLLLDPAARAELAQRGADLARGLGDWPGYARACLAFYESASSSR